jgi:hypothetical protein
VLYLSNLLNCLPRKSLEDLKSWEVGTIENHQDLKITVKEGWVCWYWVVTIECCVRFFFSGE